MRKAEAEQRLREKIRTLVKDYYALKFSQQAFVPGTTRVRYAGRVFDEKEIQAGVEAVLDFWLTQGRFSEQFESSFAVTAGTEYSLIVNSGSSANFLAIAALASPLLGDKRLRPGDEVIAVAAAFPTTVNPIIQNGLIPVFVDIDLPTYNVNVAQLVESIGPQTRAIFLAHTLGNPFDLESIEKACRERELYLIEDCCDALGSTYKGQKVGTFGEIGSCSFYPAHHITMGEGGAVFTDDDALVRAARSLRDWGRDCYCASGENNTCGKRFTGEYGTLPKGYDHKYVYSHIGYNLKATDIQAAIGVEQLKKLPEFISKRKANFSYWKENFKQWEDRFILPEATFGSDPAWFGFPLTLRDSAGFTRVQLTDFLDSKLIETRNIFAGNLLRQPAYQGITCRIIGNLATTDQVMSNSFFLGTYPGLSKEQMDYVLDQIGEFLRGKT
jgi:CDP-6-deoxy-D-xylo-4-hexulose-3-dehydrase